jgi:hypothetical protein
MSRIKAGTAVEKVIAVNGDFVDKNQTVIVGQKYYLKHSDITVRLKDSTFYVVPFNIDGKECWRRPYPINREFDWVYNPDGSGQYAQITDDYIEGVVNEKGDIGKFLRTENTVEVLDISSGRVSSRPFIKLFPKLIAKSVIDGKFYLIPESKELAKALFEPYNEQSSYCREYHQMLSPKRINARSGYSVFDVRQYGEAGNSAFSTCQKTSDEYWKKNTKTRSIDKFEKTLVFPSIGVEFEAHMGYIDENDCLNLGLVPVKDGSLEGNSFEYITTVIKENKLNRLLTTTEYINKILSVNRSCSLHAHIGGIPATEKNVVALWMLLYQIDRDLFQILPPYKKAIEYFISKRQAAKDHCKPLPHLNLFELCPKAKKGYTEAVMNSFVASSYSKILTFLNEGRFPERTSGGYYKHNKEGRNKWESETRYYAVNFLPWLFEKKGTIEFRTHSGTTNPTKTINWVFIINAIIKYALENTEDILSAKDKINLSDIIEYAYADEEELCEYLKAYIYSRKLMNETLYSKGDIYGDEFINDNKYQFKHKAQKEIYG